VSPHALPRLKLKLKGSPSTLPEPSAAAGAAEADGKGRSPAPPPAPVSAEQRRRAITDWLRETCPLAFAEVRPLAVGIYAAVIERMREAGLGKRQRKAVNGVLRHYTKSNAYLTVLAEPGSRRIHLDGSDAGEVEEDHRAHARELLAARLAADEDGAP
jgi:ProP effector